MWREAAPGRRLSLPSSGLAEDILAFAESGAGDLEALLVAVVLIVAARPIAVMLTLMPFRTPIRPLLPTFRNVSA